MRTALAILHDLDVKAAPAAAPPDIAKVAKPAPGASPVGAFAFLAGDDGTQAWLVKDGDKTVGYLRDATQPDRAIEVDDAEAWAQIVDQLGLSEQAVPTVDDTQPPADATPAPPADPAAPAASADATPPADPAAATPAPAGAAPVKTQGKAAAAGQVVTPDDHEEQTGIMVALMMPEGDAADIMLTDFPTALPASELHLTLAYLGKTEEVDDEGAYYANVLEALRDVAAQHDTLNGVVSGVGRFSVPGDADAFYYSFDAPELPDLRHDLVEALEEAGIDVSRDHGFTPHITICYLKEGEESPIRRAESKVLAFENLTFCYGDQRLNIRLGGTDPEEADAEFHMEAGRPGQFDTTAPSAIPDAKAKPNPFAKGGKKGGPPIATGAWVSWGNQRGRVDLVVTNGKVPGVEEDITGSTDKPAARVVVYEQGAGGKWKATGKKVGVSASGLKRSFPLTGGGGKFGKKDLDPEAVLVDLLTGYYEATLVDGQVKEAAVVDPAAVWTVYERGIASWPGEHTEVANEAWALGRTKAFLAVASGREVPGYEADRDLLPEEHPLAAKAAPALTVVEASAPEVKVAVTVAEGERLDAETFRQTIASLRALGIS